MAAAPVDGVATVARGAASGRRLERAGSRRTGAGGAMRPARAGAAAVLPASARLAVGARALALPAVVKRRVTAGGRRRRPVAARPARLLALT